MRKKKLFYALSFCLAAAFMSACGGNTDGTLSEEIVAVLYCAYEDAYISDVRAALNRELEAGGIHYQAYDGEGDQITQTEQVSAAIAQGATVLAINLVDSDSAGTVEEITGIVREEGLWLIFFGGDMNEDTAGIDEKCVILGESSQAADLARGVAEAVKACLEKSE